MSIFEKIKQFFKNIGNKQKLLESPKEIREEMGTMVSSDKKESKFLEDIKFDPKDLLDPRICQGDNFVPNILRTLGANEDICKNPKAIEAIKLQFFGITNQNGLEMPNHFEQPTREQIDAIVEAVKSSMILSKQDRDSAYRSQSLRTPLKIHYGLSIDSETGNVTIGRLRTAGSEVSWEPNSYSETTFSADGKGNVVAMSSSQRESRDTHTEILDMDSRTVYNSDGIAMESESHSYEQVDGEDKVTYHRVAKRDAEYPFIAQEDILVNDISLDKHTGTRYMAIDMKDLSQLGYPEYQKDENGHPTQPITFDDRAQISEYYKENKETIDDVLLQEPEYQPHRANTLEKALFAGIKKLAVKAGIIPNEHEQENEIAE